jgi:hypothetical protein
MRKYCEYRGDQAASDAAAMVDAVMPTILAEWVQNYAGRLLRALPQSAPLPVAEPLPEFVQQRLATLALARLIGAPDPRVPAELDLFLGSPLFVASALGFGSEHCLSFLREAAECYRQGRRPMTSREFRKALEAPPSATVVGGFLRALQAGADEFCNVELADEDVAHALMDTACRLASGLFREVSVVRRARHRPRNYRGLAAHAALRIQLAGAYNPLQAANLMAACGLIDPSRRARKNASDRRFLAPLLALADRAKSTDGS